jgi:hypothetical protein
MAEREKPYEEARKDAEAFLRGDSFRPEVFRSRYENKKTTRED